jgi:hypothetical protein
VFRWSDDCLSCLSNLPHSLEEHNQALEQARIEREYQREEMRRLIDDDGTEDECFSPEQSEALK